MKKFELAKEVLETIFSQLKIADCNMKIMLKGNDGDSENKIKGNINSRYINNAALIGR